MIYISNERILNNEIRYNSNHVIVQHVYKKWKIKQQYKELYKMLAEGLLIITVMIFSLMSLFIWFY